MSHDVDSLLGPEPVEGGIDISVLHVRGLAAAAGSAGACSQTWQLSWFLVMRDLRMIMAT